MSRLFLLLFALLLCQSNAFLLAQQDFSWETFIRPTAINEIQQTEEASFLATNGGVVLLDPATHAITGHWTRQSHNLPSNMIEDIAFDPASGLMVIGTYDLGVFRATDGENDSWEPVPFPQDLVNNSNQIQTYCLDFDNQGRLCVGTNRGLLILNQDEEWELYGPNDFNNLVHAVWDMKVATDSTLYAGGNITLKIRDGLVEAHTAVPLDGPQFSDSLHFAYGDREFFLLPNDNLWDLGDIGQVARSTPEGEWSLYGFQFQPDAPHFSIFNRNFIQNGQLHIESGDHYVRFNEGSWDSIPTPYSNDNLHTVFSIDDQLFGTQADDFYQLAISEETPSGQMGNWPFAGYLRGLFPDPAGYCWTSTNTAEMLNLNTNEVLELPQHQSATGFQNVHFAPLPSNDIWLQRGSELVQWQDRQTLISHPFADAAIEPHYIREVTFSASGTPWYTDDQNRVFSLQNDLWELRYDFGSDGFCYALLPTQDEEMIAFHYLSGNFNVKQCSPSGVSDFELPDFLNEGQLFNAYGSIDHDIYLLDRMTNEVARFSEGQWSQTSFPADLESGDFIRLLHAQDNEVTIVTNRKVMTYDGTNWTHYNTQNSPIDTRDIQAAAFGADGELYLLHGNVISQSLEILRPAPLSSVEIPAALQQLNLAVAPNPATDYLTFQNPLGSARYAIFDQTGRLLMNGTTTTTNNRLSLTTIPSGVYYLRLTDGVGLLTAKVVLKK